MKDSDTSGILRIQEITKSANHCRISLRDYVNESISCVTETRHRSWDKDWKSKVWDSKSSKKSTVNVGCPLQLGWSQTHFGSRCLYWWNYCYIDIIRLKNYGFIDQSFTTSWGRSWTVSTERAYNVESSIKIDYISEYVSSEHPEHSGHNLNSSIPTTSLQINTTAATVTVPDNGRPRKTETETIMIDTWPQPTEFWSWKINFKSEVIHSS